MEELKAKFPGRTSQIEQLFSLYGNSNEPFPNCVFVSGGPSTGKTSIIMNLLEKLDIKYASINLFECYTSKILFETLLNKLSGHTIDPRTGQPYAKCDNMMDFLYYLNKCENAADLSRSVIVLDKAEQLRNMDSNLLPAFLKFFEISGYPISVILVSEIVFQKFYTKLNIVEPLKIFFPQYIKDELLEILARDYQQAIEDVYSNREWKKTELDEDFYRDYLNVFLSVFYRACRDLSELRYMAKLNFVKYCEPIIKDEKATNNSIALWRHIAPILKTTIEVLYLRISSVNHENKYEINKSDFSDARVQKQFSFSKENLAQSLELPFYAKYLLIAAYLASYNPAKEDKRLFMKYHGKKQKTKRDVKNKSKVSELLSTQLGPKAFSFDRLLAIFYAILDDKVAFNNNLLVQVSSLVQLQLLTALSDNYNLDGQKYKCSVGFDFIQAISKMVGFNIRKYLVDFSHI